MGIGNHELYFLKYISKKISFNSVATIGRQLLVSSPEDIKKIIGTNCHYEGYCEELLKKEFNVETVTSYDVSDYEGVDYVCDFNDKLEVNKTYDLVIDFGSLEHIFNIFQAVKNISQLCKVGGHIIHSNPSNEFCGHGFYQFSPEFYYTLYSEENGFSETEIYLAEYPEYKKNINYWYKTKKPQNGKRFEFFSDYGVGNLVFVKKKEHKIFSKIIQSDYGFIYKSVNKEKKIEVKNLQKFKNFLKKFSFLKKIASVYGLIRYNLKKKRNAKLKYLNKNKNFTKIYFRDIID